MHRHGINEPRLEAGLDLAALAASVSQSRTFGHHSSKGVLGFHPLQDDSCIEHCGGERDVHCDVVNRPADVSSDQALPNQLAIGST